MTNSPWWKRRGCAPPGWRRSQRTCGCRTHGTSWRRPRQQASSPEIITNQSASHTKNSIRKTQLQNTHYITASRSRGSTVRRLSVYVIRRDFFRSPAASRTRHPRSPSPPGIIPYLSRNPNHRWQKDRAQKTRPGGKMSADRISPPMGCRDLCHAAAIPPTPGAACSGLTWVLGICLATEAARRTVSRAMALILSIPKSVTHARQAGQRRRMKSSRRTRQSRGVAPGLPSIGLSNSLSLSLSWKKRFRGPCRVAARAHSQEVCPHRFGRRSSVGSMGRSFRWLRFWS